MSGIYLHRQRGSYLVPRRLFNVAHTLRWTATMNVRFFIVFHFQQCATLILLQQNNLFSKTSTFIFCDNNIYSYLLLYSSIILSQRFGCTSFNKHPRSHWSFLNNVFLVCVYVYIYNILAVNRISVHTIIIFMHWCFHRWINQKDKIFSYTDKWFLNVNIIFGYMKICSNFHGKSQNAK